MEPNGGTSNHHISFFRSFQSAFIEGNMREGTETRPWPDKGKQKSFSPVSPIERGTAKKADRPRRVAVVRGKRRVFRPEGRMSHPQKSPQGGNLGV